MADKNSSSRFAQELLRIHRVISRGLIVSVAKGTDFMQARFPDPEMRKGYTDYTRSLAAVLDAHHLVEDEIVFPYLKDKVTAVPYEQLARHHQAICALLDPAEKAIPPVAEKGLSPDLAVLLDVLRKIANLWRPHIQAEEFYFTEDALAAAVSPEEQERLSTAMAKYSQEHAAPPALTMPFVLFNLEAQDRAAMAASLPAEVVEELIPKTWKEQWAAMKPFLLE